MAKLRFIEVPHPKKGNGIRYKDVLVKFVNDMRTELHELDSLGQAFGLALFISGTYGRWRRKPY